VGRTPEIIHLSELCLSVSGSVGLELLWGLKPAAVMYRTSLLMKHAAQLLARCKYASLVNLLADQPLYPEFLSADCQSRGIAEVLQGWLTNPAVRKRLVEQLSALRERVAQPGACERAAEYVIERCAARTPLRRLHAA
jgi:lipid-A-disaccharide synthase